MPRMPSRSGLAAGIATFVLWTVPRQHPARRPTGQGAFRITGPTAIARVRPQDAAGTLGVAERSFLEKFNRLGDSLERQGYLVAVSFRDTVLVIPPPDSIHLSPWRLVYRYPEAYFFTPGRDPLAVSALEWRATMPSALREHELGPRRGPRVVALRATSLTFRALGLGGQHTCARTVGDRVFCWGANEAGQLGTGTTTDTTRPAAVVGARRFVELAVGGYHVCARTERDEVFCWGMNGMGQVGDGTRLNRQRPVAIKGQLRFVGLTAGAGHTCGLTASGAAYCWGSNGSGQLGVGGGSDPVSVKTAPVAVAGGLRFAQLAAGPNHTCGVTASGAAYCWGSNSQGELGDSTRAQKLVPVAVAAGLRFAALGALGYFHTCGLTRDGRAFCWGGNEQGALGDSTQPDQATPTAVAGGLRFVELSAGYYHTCGRTAEGLGFCWGGSNNGERGDGEFTAPAVRRPKAVAGGLHFVELRAGGQHTCGRTREGAAFCWGWNGHGELGDGNTSPSLGPVQVMPQR